jgi:hypothetical protein
MIVSNPQSVIGKRGRSSGTSSLFSGKTCETIITTTAADVPSDDSLPLDDHSHPSVNSLNAVEFKKFLNSGLNLIRKSIQLTQRNPLHHQHLISRIRYVLSLWQSYRIGQATHLL